MSEPIRRRLAEAASWVEDGLRELDVYDRDPSALSSMARYVLEAGGKRVRPFLVRESCRAAGGTDERALHAACAVEMVHTYSLVHDDLPVMDDDDTRRGVATLHVRHDPGRAVLAGDLLLVEAFGELLRTPLGPARVAGMTAMLAAAAGPGHLVGGQYMDMRHPERPDRAWIDRMVLGKTAAMIRVSMELGAMAGGLDDRLLPAVSALGDRLGALFQLTDDVLDVCGDEEEMGKGVSKDADSGKVNLVSLLGLEEAGRMARDTASELAADLAELRGDWEGIGELALYLPERRS